MRGLFVGLMSFVASATLTISIRNDWLPVRLVDAPTGTVTQGIQNNSNGRVSGASGLFPAAQSTARPLGESAPAPLPQWAEESARPISNGPERPVPNASPEARHQPELNQSAIRGRPEERRPNLGAPIQSIALQIEEPVERSRSSEMATECAQKVNEANRLIAERQFLPAQKLLSQAYWDHVADRSKFHDTLTANAERIFLQPQPHFIEPYVVKPGDQMQAIARNYKVSWQYLSKLNKTAPMNIRPDQKLKVIRGPFSAHVDLSDFLLTVHLQGYFVKQYRVGIGRDGSSPRGKFTVLNKVENPQYTDPEGRVMSGNDPRNPLGERWVDLGGSYGIHGTIEPDSIGKAESRGCVRLLPNDVIEVYDFLIMGSEVVIED